MSDKGGHDSSEGDSIKVFVRVRPPDKGDNELGAQKGIEVDDQRNSVTVRAKPEPKVFSFDKVADINITQEAVFCAVGKGIIDGCLNGYNGTIFAYGQTGSGKTFTMLGPSEDSESFQHELRGVTPRSFEYLFSHINREQQLHGDRKQFLCRCSFLEIYQECVYDLLDPSAEGLHLRENIKKGVFVDGISEQAVASPSEAYDVLSSGWINRRVAATSMNRESSRSHAVFTLAIESKEQKGGVQNVRMSQLNLVDLAGSERQKDTNAAGQRLKEAGCINKSLSTLGNVMMSLVDIAHGKSRHVPYRDSKLTFLLRDSLGGNAKTHIVACIHPGSKCFGETLSTLQFARRAKMIKNKAVVNEDTQGNILHLQAEIRRLKDQLLQFQMEGAPRELPPFQGGSDSAPVTMTTGGDSEWRKNFIESMFFREKAETEKKNLTQTIKDLEDVAKKREKFNQSREMVMKFREKDIEILKKEVAQLKTRLAGGEDENAKDHHSSKENDQIASLREEMKVLTERIKCHPVVVRQNVELQKLRTELKQLKNNDNYRQAVISDNRKIEELDKVFKELMAEKSKVADDETPGGKKLVSPYSTPQTGDKVAVATVEKYKSQVANLQKEIEGMKATLTETKETSEKKIIELGAELSSAKQMNEEVMRSLKMRQLHYDYEKKTLNDLHTRTIETITTPQRARYNLRNRSIHEISQVKAVSPDLNQTIEMEDGILGEDIPEIMNEAAHEALTGEIKQLQESNNKLSERLEEYESDVMRIRQQTLKYESQIEQLNDILKKERSERAIEVEEYENSAAKMKKDLEETRETSRVNGEEASDLRVMIKWVDKEKADMEKRDRVAEESRQKAVTTLETQLMKISMEFEQVQKLNEGLSKDLDMALENMENKQLTVQFQESCIKELEDKNKDGIEKQNKLQAMIQSLEDQVEQKDCDLETLRTQIRTDSASQEQQAGKFLDEINNLKSAATLLQNECDAHHNTEDLLKQELDKSAATITSLEKELAKDRASVASLWNTIQDQKTKLGSLKEEQLTLESRLTNKTQQHDILQSAHNNQVQHLASLEHQVLQLQEEAAAVKIKFDVEMSVVQDSMEHMSEQQERAQEDLQETRNHLAASQAECAKLQEKIALLTNEIKNDEEQKNYSNKTILELEKLMNQNDVLLQEKNDSISMYQKDFGQLQCERNCLEERCCMLEAELQNVHAQASLLDAQVKEKEELVSRAEEEANQAKHQTERHHKAKMELIESMTDRQRRLEDLENSMKTLVDENTRLAAVCIKDREEKSIKHSELEVLKEHYSKSQTELEETLEKVKSLQEEVAKMGGHMNLKQKIKLFQKTKAENFELTNLNQQLKTEVLRLQMDLARHTGAPTTPKQILHHKENIKPGSRSSHCERTMSAQRKGQERQTLFLSGDYTPSDVLKKARLESKRPASSKKTKQETISNLRGQQDAPVVVLETDGPGQDPPVVLEPVVSQHDPPIVLEPVVSQEDPPIVLEPVVFQQDADDHLQDNQADAVEGEVDGGELQVEDSEDMEIQFKSVRVEDVEAMT
ncbi:kinesin-like protein KIF15-B isoform X1 [Haliotis cracherodii]|uniref:kinesin-like protein KIF15-B isoform X1 n=1 Tax=Haliotis cracherodii TaxID=6455 RepID=UPI0039EB2E81